MRFARPFAVLVLVAGLGCGDDGGSPIVPTAIVVVSGDNQSALPGDSVGQRLVVNVTGSDNRPFVGGRVTWTVTNGSAALAQGVDTTDANGESSNKLTIGVQPGAIAVNAAVTGVTGATFSATGLDPCDVLIDHTVGVPQTGVLTGFDCQFGGPFFTDFYRVVLPAQQSFAVTLTATFDTYMEQYHLSGPFIAVNDDLDSLNTNSRITIIAAAGTYVVAASTFNASTTGAYGLSSVTQAEALAGCPADPLLPWITRGVALSQQLQATDCTTGRAGGGSAFSDRALITLSNTRGIDVTLASGVFPPRLELYQVSGVAGPTLVASNTGSGGSSTLTYTPTASQIFRLEITTADTAQSGAYTLNVTGPAPGAAATELLVGPAAWRAVGDARAAMPSGKRRR